MNTYLSNAASRKLTINEQNAAISMGLHEINVNDSFCKNNKKSKANSILQFASVQVAFETSYCEVQQDTVCVITIA